MINEVNLFSGRRILILGCGWVGEELALSMLAKGGDVWVTTTTERKVERFTALGLKALLVNFDKEINHPALNGYFDYVLNSVPASSRHRQEEIANRFKNVRQLLKGLEFSKQIFLSSVGIYPDSDGVFDEAWQGPQNEKLALAENEMSTVVNTMIYRLGGLFGKERIFAKYFSGKICNTGSQPSNFVHITDVVALVELGFLKAKTGEKYNIVAPEHPTKREVIMASAQKFGFDLPLAFENTICFQKLVIGSKIVEQLDYTFTYSSPLLF